MSEMPQKNIDNQEIDLAHVSRRIGLFFENFSTSIFNGILFLKRNLLFVIILI